MEDKESDTDQWKPTILGEVSSAIQAAFDEARTSGQFQPALLLVESQCSLQTVRNLGNTQGYRKLRIECGDIATKISEEKFQITLHKLEELTTPSDKFLQSAKSMHISKSFSSFRARRTNANLICIVNWGIFLESQRIRRQVDHVDEDTSSFTKVSSVWSFIQANKTVQIFGVRCSPLEAVLSSPSTCQMNIIMNSHAIALFPQPTLKCHQNICWNQGVRDDNLHDDSEETWKAQGYSTIHAPSILDTIRVKSGFYVGTTRYPGDRYCFTVALEYYGSHPISPDDLHCNSFCVKFSEHPNDFSFIKGWNRPEKIVGFTPQSQPGFVPMAHMTYQIFHFCRKIFAKYLGSKLQFCPSFNTLLVLTQQHLWVQWVLVITIHDASSQLQANLGNLSNFKATQVSLKSA
ncbi:hypothetical protein BDP27DRAFT_1362797 [Rhodocollybia butyracea]|uniref:Uncharacterized protein n=1 Tax=Rhodocollybia butyracea TaxID=206335 RepID=A0A9P5PXZ8_9AGAR|nr:hypothetical protein BDP27DRAFT_1362797 [Rhodocollybia butyracea]